jgi:uncharacterized protein
MTRIFDDTFIIKTGSDYIAYSPLVGINALINRKGVQELKKQLMSGVNGKGDPESKLFELAQNILQSPVQNPLRKSGNLNPEFLGVITTRSCNGACNYCDFGADKASTDRMTYQLAAKIVDWYAGLMISHKREFLEIHFFGGEPMMSRDVIEVIIHRARLVSMEQNLVPVFEISTNGQYSDGDAKFLGQYFNKVILSLDGFREAHNRHRPLKENRSSFENAVKTAKIISSLNADLCIRSCISQENIMYMEEFTKWLCNNLRLSAINFEILRSSSQTDSLQLFPPDPVEFAIHFQRSREIAESFNIEVVYASDIANKPVVSSCPVGLDTVIVKPDGTISNCYLLTERWQKAGLDLDFGILDCNGTATINNEKVNEIRRMVEDKPRCSRCFCKWSCAGGCHVGITYPGSGLEYDNFCIQTRIISTFTILTELGLQNKIDELIREPATLLDLAYQPTDRLDTFND